MRLMSLFRGLGARSNLRAGEHLDFVAFLRYVDICLTQLSGNSLENRIFG